MGVLGSVLELLLSGAVTVASSMLSDKLESNETLLSIKERQSGKYADMANKVINNSSSYTDEQIKRAEETKSYYEAEKEMASERLKVIRENKQNGASEE